MFVLCGSPLKMSVSHCRRSISFPTGLFWLSVYAWVAMSDVPAHISVLSSVLPSPSSSIPVSVSSVLLFPAVSSLSWFTHVVVILLPVSARLFSKCSQATVFFMSSIICFSPDTSFAKPATSVHPLHVNMNPSSLVSAHFFSHPEV